MRDLTATLLAAQKQPAVVPYVRLEAQNTIAGVVRLDWARLYTGFEADNYHALTMPEDGSLIRVRVTSLGDSRKLYRQRVTDPGPGSDFSQWNYCSQYDVVVVAAAALGAEVSICWINSSREIRRISSTDYGATWGGPELIDYSPTTAVYGLTAAYKDNGDLAIFFADQATLYVKKRVNGQWQARFAWNKTTGDLSGVTCVYDDDWNLVASGQDAQCNYKLWSLVYGDGGDVVAGSWSPLRELASAPAGGDFAYCQPFLDKTDVYRCFFVEKFSGTQDYNRPFFLCQVPETGFIDSLWREPVPFNLSAEYGLAMAHDGDYSWLSCPARVWRAALGAHSLDITDDIISIRQDLGETKGELVVALRNDDGRYAAPGQAGLAVLDIGCQLAFSPGCVTAVGEECSAGPSFSLEAYEHSSSYGKAVLTLRAQDGWGHLGRWQARHQFRWNASSDDTCVKDILAFVLARAGLKLEVKSESEAITAFYPDFTISPGNDGVAIVSKLLSFVPDVIFIEGFRAYLVNPLAEDSSVYSYGVDHTIYEGIYGASALQNNRVQIEGYDAGSGDLIVADVFEWDEIGRLYDRLYHLEDMNLGTVAAAQSRGETCLREAQRNAQSGFILVPVNCGQQLYDVVDVTDARAGLDSVKKQICGITLVYHRLKGEYRQRLTLGSV
jgi:hypothetical protein